MLDIQVYHSDFQFVIASGNPINRYSLFRDRRELLPSRSQYFFCLVRVVFILSYSILHCLFLVLFLVYRFCGLSSSWTRHYPLLQAMSPLWLPRRCCALLGVGAVHSSYSWNCWRRHLQSSWFRVTHQRCLAWRLVLWSIEKVFSSLPSLLTLACWLFSLRFLTCHWTYSKWNRTLLISILLHPLTEFN